VVVPVLDIPEMEMQVPILMVVQAVVDQVLLDLVDLVELMEILVEQENLQEIVVEVEVEVLEEWELLVGLVLMVD